MYEVLDVKKMMKVSSQTRRRAKPIAGFNSTILLKPGTDLSLIPPDSEIRYANGSWECHTMLSNKKILKKLSKALDAVAFLCYK